ncbi:MAG: type II toxin-antitoxin system RelE/ParE family toxin [Prosthecobacter sp.]|uniref:type II toxin-antitoxin system RelE/ParE family toxin n=1 Tax=Prosthecobacter sp. TaxID=1965333 RepID=UPI003BB03B9D
MPLQAIRSHQSILDLEEIWSYIAQDSELHADRWIIKLNEHMLHLAAHNGLGRPRPELAAGLRSSPLKDYIVFYRSLGETGIEVIRVLHSSRDIRPEFFGG